MKQIIETASRIISIFGFIVLLLLFLIMLKSCLGLFYTKMTHLTPEELAWGKSKILEPPGIFVSDSGRISLLTLTLRFVDNSGNPFYLNEGKSSYYEANTGYGYEIKDSLRTLEGYFCVVKPVDYDSLMATYWLGAMHSHSGQKMNVTTFRLKDRVIEDCLIIDTTMVSASGRLKDNYDYLVDEFVISKEYGPIYYRLKSGEEFFRKLGK